MDDLILGKTNGTIKELNNAFTETGECWFDTDQEKDYFAGLKKQGQKQREDQRSLVFS